MTSEKERFEVLLEHIETQVQLLAEGIVQLQSDITQIKADTSQMKQELSRIPPIELVVLQHEDKLVSHGKRIAKLEKQAA